MYKVKCTVMYKVKCRTTTSSLKLWLNAHFIAFAIFAQCQTLMQNMIVTMVDTSSRTVRMKCFTMESNTVGFLAS